MARIKWGLFVTDGRGKVGGHVLSKNRQGAYIRTKVTPVNPQTNRQTTVRALFGSISGAWSGLSTTVIAGWNEAVSEWQTTDIFGDLKKPSGKALFQRLNNQAQIAGWPAVTTAPAKEDMVTGIVTKATISIGDEELTFVGQSISPSARVIVFATPPVSAGTSFVKNKLRQIYVDPANTISSSDMFMAYSAKYGTPVLADNIYLGVKYVLANGQASPMQVFKATITA